MSTNNFTIENICVVVHDTTEYYCEACEEYQENEDKCGGCGTTMVDNHIHDFYDSDIEEWQQILDSKIKSFVVPNCKSWTRKGGAYILGSIDIQKQGGEHYATVYATYKGGYYCWASLDYYIEYEEEDNIASYNTKVDRACHSIAKLLRTFGKEIIKVGQFSNGEAVYKPLTK
jgi:hypothetical protein